MDLSPEIILALSVGAVAGLLLGLIIAGIGPWRRLLKTQTQLAALQSQLKSQDELDLERDSALQLASERLALAFDDLANRSLSRNNETFLALARQNLGAHHERAKGELTEKELAVAQLVSPIQEALKKTEQKLHEIEKERHMAYGNISQQLRAVAQSQVDLKSETQNLVKALRRPEVRGQWGELTLRRVAELAGLVKHCDFLEQVHNEKDGVVTRPDMVVRMPEDRTIVVDAKTPLDGYLEAMEASDDTEKKAALARHTQNLKARVKELAGKQYWSQFDHSPEFVVLFIPGEQFLAAALDQDPLLQESAIQKKVLLATPTSLIGLLKVVAYGWRQVSLAKNAAHIKELGEELYGRIVNFTGHLSRLGKQLSGGVTAFNSAVGSLERKVIPSARKFKDMGISDDDTLPNVAPVQESLRQVNPSGRQKLTDPENS